VDLDQQAAEIEHRGGGDDFREDDSWRDAITVCRARAFACRCELRKKLTAQKSKPSTAAGSHHGLPRNLKDWSVGRLDPAGTIHPARR
jgi:hypothetical protein